MMNERESSNNNHESWIINQNHQWLITNQNLNHSWPGFRIQNLNFESYENLVAIPGWIHWTTDQLIIYIWYLIWYVMYIIWVFDWTAWPGLHVFRILRGVKDYLLCCSGYGHPFQICSILKSESSSSVISSKYACQNEKHSGLFNVWAASTCDAKIINAPAVLLRQTAKAIWFAIASKQMVHPFSSFLSQLWLWWFDDEWWW